jgi:hypothetical protein
VLREETPPDRPIASRRDRPPADRPIADRARTTWANRDVVYETSTRRARAKNDPIAIRRIADCVESANCRIGAAHTPTRRARIEAERDGAPEVDRRASKHRAA